MNLPEPINFPERYAGFRIDRRRDTLPDGYASAERASAIEVLGVTSIFRRRIVLIGAIVAICALAAIVLTLAMPKQYVSYAAIAIDSPSASELPGISKQEALPQAEALDERVETELQVLTSRVIAERLLVDQNLPEDPALQRAVMNPPSLLTNLLRVIGIRRSAPEMPEGIEQSNGFRQAAIDYVDRALDAAQLGQSSAVRLTFTTSDANLSRRLADGLADTYIQESISAKILQNRRVLTLLRGRIDELRLQAEHDFGDVQRYRIENNLLSASATSLTENEISSYNQQAAAARAEASRDQAELQAARSQLRGGAGEVGAGTTSGVVASLRAQRASLSANIADMQARYRPDHPDLLAAQRQLGDIDRQIDREVGRTIRELESRAASSGSRFSSLAQSQSSARGTLAQNNASLIALDGLQRRAQASQELYESYLNRYKETVARSGAETSDARVLSPARLFTHPVSPQPILNLAFGIVAGLVLGGLVAIGMEVNFNGFTTPEDVERKLGLPYLGSLPLLKATGLKVKTCEEAIRIQPGGMMAESMRSIAMRLSHLAGGLKVLAVTSAVAGEGKSTLAGGLARVLGRAGVRVVLIDCDVVRPELSRRSGADGHAPGLFEVIAGTATIDEALAQVEDSNVWLLPITSPFGAGERLTQGDRLRDVVAICRERFDTVILDCSPVLLIAESREIVRMADVTLFSVLWRKTSVVTVNAALRLLPDEMLSRLGIALNRVDIRKRRRFGSSDASFFYRRYRDYYADAG